MKHIKTFENFELDDSSNMVLEMFRDGDASHYNSLLKDWSDKYNVPFEWNFREVGKKTKSYFDLKLSYKKYEELPHDAKIELNKLNKQFNVDFRYRNKMWTPVIESTKK